MTALSAVLAQEPTLTRAVRLGAGGQVVESAGAMDGHTTASKVMAAAAVGARLGTSTGLGRFTELALGTAAASVFITAEAQGWVVAAGPASMNVEATLKKLNNALGNRG